MATEKHERIYSNIAISPGEILSEELEARDMTTSELASILGYAPEVVDGIITGESPLTRETALALEKALGSKANIWLNLESSYRTTKAEIERNTPH